MTDKATTFLNHAQSRIVWNSSLPNMKYVFDLARHAVELAYIAEGYEKETGCELSQLTDYKDTVKQLPEIK